MLGTRPNGPPLPAGNICNGAPYPRTIGIPVAGEVPLARPSPAGATRWCRLDFSEWRRHEGRRGSETRSTAKDVAHACCGDCPSFRRMGLAMHAYVIPTAGLRGATALFCGADRLAGPTGSAGGRVYPCCAAVPCRGAHVVVCRRMPRLSARTGPPGVRVQPVWGNSAPSEQRMKCSRRSPIHAPTTLCG
jgi:hypothetical protein